MRELVIVAIVIAVIALIWYLRQGSGRAAKQRAIHDPPLESPGNQEAGRAAPDIQKLRSGPAELADTPRRAGKSAGLFQDVADSAAGVPYERARDQMEQMTGDLADARRAAEHNAEEMANRAAETLAAIDAAAAARGGAVPGDGTHRCPPDYPVKAIMAAMRYHAPDRPGYDLTIPDICFESAVVAEAAGFSAVDAEVVAEPRALPIDEVRDEGTITNAEPEGQQASSMEDRR